MDQPKLCDLLRVPYGSLFRVDEVRLRDWGGGLVLDCRCEPGQPDSPVPFQIILKDCRDIQWRVYAHLSHTEGAPLPPTPVVNIKLGSPTHRKPLALLTDAFGVTISYGEIAIHRTG